MAESGSRTKLLLQKRRLLRHLLQMKAALPDLLEHAFDRFYEAQALTYLKIEEKAYRFESLITKLEVQVETTDSMGLLRQVAGRVNYIADQLDEVESTVFKRPRRRKRATFNFAEFFEKFSNQNRNGASSSGQEISSLSEAYAILELEEGCNLAQLMTAFRRLAKKYHPDARGGDRSDEAALRQVVEAYQIIKESFAA